jgi:hypothetical protein
MDRGNVHPTYTTFTSQPGPPALPLSVRPLRGRAGCYNSNGTARREVASLRRNSVGEHVWPEQGDAGLTAVQSAWPPEPSPWR